MATRGRPRKSKTRIEFESSVKTASVPEQDKFFPTIDSEGPAVESIAADNSEKNRIKKETEKIPEIFTPEQVVWVFDVYVGIVCFVYSILLKTDFNALHKELKFEAEEKQQMAIPLSKILSKHAPAEWAGMSAEIELITCLGIWTVTSFTRAKQIAEKEKEAKQLKERTVPVRPVPVGEAIPV